MSVVLWRCTALLARTLYGNTCSQANEPPVDATYRSGSLAQPLAYRRTNYRRPGICRSPNSSRHMAASGPKPQARSIQRGQIRAGNAVPAGVEAQLQTTECRVEYLPSAFLLRLLLSRPALPDDCSDGGFASPKTLPPDGLTLANLRVGSGASWLVLLYYKYLCFEYPGGARRPSVNLEERWVSSEPTSRRWRIFIS